MHKILITPGSFLVGTNYWASHAGTAMWRDWQADVVERDFRTLAEEGLQVLRVFPLWPDFQPITQLYGGTGRPVEIRHGEEPLPETEAGQAGVSIEAIQRFEEFMRLAAKHNLKLIVGLITGWMSGRLFVPPALEGRNVLTDPVALLWEMRLVRYFVRYFKDNPAIAAWDLGNECNCMAPVPHHEAAWTWTATIVNAIRAVDPERPIISGMHSLTPTGDWRMQDQGELTDVLTTHPYPVFTPYCNQDPVNTIRTQLHATAESLFYAELGGKPCFAEELGTLGPMVASDAVAADFIRAGLFSLWAHDLRGLLWWCASDQTALTHAPYDWHAMERELGLLRSDGTPKPVIKELGKFRALVDGLPQPLPPRVKEAVCILSDAQDQWGVAYSTFILAKQAGFDLEFQYETQPLKDAGLYLLPCISGHRVIHRRRYMKLMARVAEGATLYISYAGGFMSQFEELTGLRVLTRFRGMRETAFAWVDTDFTLGGDYKLTLESVRAEVLGVETDGNPAFTRAPYGKGWVYFLGFPLEMALTTTPGAFHTPEAQPFWKLYRAIAQPFMQKRAIVKHHPMLGVTEHPLDTLRRVVVVINYSPEPVETTLDLAPGWTLGPVWYGVPTRASGSTVEISLPQNDAYVAIVEKQA
ncbi:MAG: cellulase family glycosylhydrolase [Anaerolineae bacterium]|nr:cellulase family glycosylhydrolase [Anaerolineae bacterium]